MVPGGAWARSAQGRTLGIPDWRRDLLAAKEGDPAEPLTTYHDACHLAHAKGVHTA